jgi:hypothetical protein
MTYWDGWDETRFDELLRKCADRTMNKAEQVEMESFLTIAKDALNDTDTASRNKAKMALVDALRADGVMVYAFPGHPKGRNPSMKADNLHRFNIEEYERIAELDLICHRIELLNGIIWCRETGQQYRFHASDFDQLVANGVIDPARVELVDGILVDLAAD